MGMGGGMGYGAMDAGFIADAGQNQSGKKESKYKDKMLIAVTVKQILQAEAGDTGDSVKIDGQTPSTVKICGTIESVEKHTTQIVYMINDTTGTIKCIHYIEKQEGESAAKFADCKEGSFVRVVGVARNPQTDPNILVYSMGVVADFNEVTYHMLEVIYCHNYALKGPPPGAAAAAAKNCTFLRPWCCGVLQHSQVSAASRHPYPNPNTSLSLLLSFRLLHACPRRQLWHGKSRGRTRTDYSGTWSSRGAGCHHGCWQLVCQGRSVGCPPQGHIRHGPGHHS